MSYTSFMNMIYKKKVNDNYSLILNNTQLLELDYGNFMDIIYKNNVNNNFFSILKSI